MGADKQFSILVLAIVALGVASFTYLVNNQPASLRFTRNGAPFYAHSVKHPESDKCVSTRELVDHFLN
jgi:hypothetical protein